MLKAAIIRNDADMLRRTPGRRKINQIVRTTIGQIANTHSTAEYMNIDRDHRPHHAFIERVVNPPTMKYVMLVNSAVYYTCNSYVILRDCWQVCCYTQGLAGLLSEEQTYAADQPHAGFQGFPRLHDIPRHSAMITGAVIAARNPRAKHWGVCLNHVTDQRSQSVLQRDLQQETQSQLADPDTDGTWHQQEPPNSSTSPTPTPTTHRLKKQQREQVARHSLRPWLTNDRIDRGNPHSGNHPHMRLMYPGKARTSTRATRSTNYSQNKINNIAEDYVHQQHPSDPEDALSCRHRSRTIPKSATSNRTRATSNSTSRRSGASTHSAAHTHTQNPEEKSRGQPPPERRHPRSRPRSTSRGPWSSSLY